MALFAGKCPKCEKSITHAKIEQLDIKKIGNPTYVGVAYSCPLCSTILSVGIDPVALKTDTVSEVVKRLKKG